MFAIDAQRREKERLREIEKEKRERERQAAAQRHLQQQQLAMQQQAQLQSSNGSQYGFMPSPSPSPHSAAATPNMIHLGYNGHPQVQKSASQMNGSKMVLNGTLGSRGNSHDVTRTLSPFVAGSSPSNIGMTSSNAANYSHYSLQQQARMSHADLGDSRRDTVAGQNGEKSKRKWWKRMFGK